MIEKLIIKERSKHFKRPFAAATLAMTVLAGCSDASSADRPPTTYDPAGNIMYATFDDRSGGSDIIQVYPGPTDAVQDTISDGTFRDGQRVVALCQTLGRSVSTHPEVGEERDSSNVWVRIEAASREHFATIVYLGNRQTLQEFLPIC